MKTETKSNYMTIRNYVIFIILSVLIISCTGKEEKPDKTGLIPEKDFISLIKEIHLADGLLANPKVQNWVLSIDSVTIYYYLAEKHGYTKEAYDKTFRYYFISKPKELTKIYDKILGELSEMESLLAKEVMISRERNSNIWTGERNYYFPDGTGTKSVEFEVSLTGSRLYTLKFTATLFPDDQSVNLKARAFTCSADSINTGIKTWYETPVFLKDGNPHTYSVRIFVASKEPTVLKGTLYEPLNCLEEWQKHIRFENVSLSIPSSDI
ncbi:MAG: DUF4296 domain-containing protein [Bacteroidetes bacterium]|nr:DUF4296 domain-containing protein [Bacteroidota bacterium]